LDFRPQQSRRGILSLLQKINPIRNLVPNGVSRPLTVVVFYFAFFTAGFFAAGFFAALGFAQQAMV